MVRGAARFGARRPLRVLLGLNRANDSPQLLSVVGVVVGVVGGVVWCVVSLVVGLVAGLSGHHIEEALARDERLTDVLPLVAKMAEWRQLERKGRLLARTARVVRWHRDVTRYFRPSNANQRVRAMRNCRHARTPPVGRFGGRKRATRAQSGHCGRRPATRGTTPDDAEGRQQTTADDSRDDTRRQAVSQASIAGSTHAHNACSERLKQSVSARATDRSEETIDIGVERRH